MLSASLRGFQKMFLFKEHQIGYPILHSSSLALCLFPKAMHFGKLSIGPWAEVNRTSSAH